MARRSVWPLAIVELTSNSVVVNGFGRPPPTAGRRTHPPRTWQRADLGVHRPIGTLAHQRTEGHRNQHGKRSDHGGSAPRDVAEGLHGERFEIPEEQADAEEDHEQVGGEGRERWKASVQAATKTVS